MARTRRQWLLGLAIAAGPALTGCAAEYVVGAAGLAVSSSEHVGTALLAVAVGDVDGDGAPDAALLDDQQRLCTLRGHNDGTLTPGGCVTLSEPAATLAVAALGASEQASLLVAGRTLSAYTATPDLTPTAPVHYPLDGSATALATAYLQCDGRRELGGCARDVLVSTENADEVAVFYGSATSGGLSGPQHFPVGPRPVALLLADLDGDGGSELITANRGTAPLTVLGPRGIATFTGCSDGRTQPALGSPSALAALDLDHNGSRVLVVADADSTTLRLLRVARSGPFTLDCGDADGSRLAIAAAPIALATADFDGDGSQDLLVAHSAPPALSLLLAQSLGLGAPRVFPIGSAVRGIAVGDLDHDGRPDVAVASSGDGTIYVMRSAFR